MRVDLLWRESEGPAHVSLFRAAGERVPQPWGWWQTDYTDWALPQEVQPVWIADFGTNWSTVEVAAARQARRLLEVASSIATAELAKRTLADEGSFRRFASKDPLRLFLDEPGEDQVHLPVAPREMVAFGVDPRAVQRRWQTDSVVATWHPYSGVGAVTLLAGKVFGGGKRVPLRGLLANWRGRSWATAQRELHDLTARWDAYLSERTSVVRAATALEQPGLTGHPRLVAENARWRTEMWGGADDWGEELP